MKLRQVAATIAVSTLAVTGLYQAAGAAAPTFTVSDTTIPAGGTVTVTLTEPCLHPNGEPEYGNVIMSGVTDPSKSDNQETKGAHFDKGDTGVFHFDTPGTYTITRFCDTPGMLDQVTITVTAPSSTTTTTAPPATTPSTTAAPGATTTTAPRSTTTAAPGATTTTAVVRSATTVATSVAGVSTTKAAGASRVAGSVSYTG